jgi:hypothetical protein
MALKAHSFSQFPKRDPSARPEKHNNCDPKTKTEAAKKKTENFDNASDRNEPSFY